MGDGPRNRPERLLKHSSYGTSPCRLGGSLKYRHVSSYGRPATSLNKPLGSSRTPPPESSRRVVTLYGQGVGDKDQVDSTRGPGRGRDPSKSIPVGSRSENGMERQIDVTGRVEDRVSRTSHLQPLNLFQVEWLRHRRRGDRCKDELEST